MDHWKLRGGVPCAKTCNTPPAPNGKSSADGAEISKGARFTVTPKLPLATFPAASTAVTPTIVVPIGNTEPLTSE